MEDKLICRNGHEVAGGHSFCPTCGAKMPELVPTDESSDDQGGGRSVKPPAWPFVLLAALVAAGLGWFLSFGGLSQAPGDSAERAVCYSRSSFDQFMDAEGYAAYIAGGRRSADAPEPWRLVDEDFGRGRSPVYFADYYIEDLFEAAGPVTGLEPELRRILAESEKLQIETTEPRREAANYSDAEELEIANEVIALDRELGEYCRRQGHDPGL